MSRQVNIILRRTHFGATYTLGELSVNGIPVGRTLEYPWRGNAAWSNKPETLRGGNFHHVSNVREGVYRAHLRSDHLNRDGGVQWRVEIEGVVGRTAIQFHAGNRLVRDSEGCILVGTDIVHASAEPEVIHSGIAMKKLISAVFGDLTRVKDPSDWARMMRDLTITVRVIGMPTGAWKVG